MRSVQWFVSRWRTRIVCPVRLQCLFPSTRSTALGEFKTTLESYTFTNQLFAAMAEKCPTLATIAKKEYGAAVESRRGHISFFRVRAHGFSLDQGGARSAPPCTQAVFMAMIAWVFEMLSKCSTRNASPISTQPALSTILFESVGQHSWIRNRVKSKANSM
jgi:hypothetical protein